MYYSFFFSSRRRHTRCGRDWSSDVCSSDSWLEPPPAMREQRKWKLTGLHEQRRCPAPRSEERRVGKECRARWWTNDGKKKIKVIYRSSALNKNRVRRSRDYDAVTVTSQPYI